MGGLGRMQDEARILREAAQSIVDGEAEVYALVLVTAYKLGWAEAEVVNALADRIDRMTGETSMEEGDPEDIV